MDFLAFVERRLIPAWVSRESASLGAESLVSIWAHASQDTSRVGSASVGVDNMRGAPFAMRTFAIVQFRRFRDCGRADRCLHPLGGGGFMKFVVFVDVKLVVLVLGNLL